MALVDYRVEGHVAIVTLNRPDARNAINPEVAVRLADAWKSIRDDGNVRVGIVTGTGSTVSMEPGFPQATVTGLRDLGYTVSITPPGGEIGSVQAVIVDAQTGKQYGAADGRREGTVIGLPRH